LRIKANAGSTSEEHHGISIPREIGEQFHRGGVDMSAPDGLEHTQTQAFRVLASNFGADAMEVEANMDSGQQQGLPKLSIIANRGRFVVNSGYFERMTFPRKWFILPDSLLSAIALEPNL